MSVGTKYCIVRSCLNTRKKDPDVAFFTIPKSPEIAKEWLEYCDRLDLLNIYHSKDYRLCSHHFLPTDFKKIKPRMLLYKHAIPSINGNAVDNEQRIQGNIDVESQQIIVESETVVPQQNSQQLIVGLLNNTVESETMVQQQNGKDNPDFIDNAVTPTEVKKTYNISCTTPRSAARLQRYRRKNNLLRCKLFRKQKLTPCICKNLVIRKPSKSKVYNLINDSKPYLSKEVHSLFAFQLKYALKNKYSRRYDEDMKDLCLMWYYSSPKSYKTLSQILNVPTSRTLRNWQSKLHVNPGINDAVLESIKLYVKDINDEHERLTSLMFDEISVKEHLQYDSSKDKIIGVVDNGETRTNTSAKAALVCMARGITKNWKYVLGYWLLGGSATVSNMYNITMKCIEKATEAGMIVKSVVCDQGPANRSLSNKLLISEMKPYFEYNNEKIYFIYDAPHLLKSVRNNLIKHDLLYKGKIVSWKHISSAIDSAHPIRIRMLPKITAEHKNVSSFNAMRVKYASQIFSDTVSVALLVFKHLGIVDNSAEHTSNFIKDMDTLFDCVNSSKLHEDLIKLRYAISKDSPHEKFLLSMRDNITNSQFVGTNKPACLKGWVITINSILQLATELREVYNVPKLLTRHLNQDALENFFANVRQQNGFCKNPTCHQFINGLKHHYIATISKLSHNSNCENDYARTLTKLTKLSAIQTSKPTHLPTELSLSLDKDLSALVNDVSAADGNGIYYVAGYVTKKFLKTHDCDKCKNILLEKEMHLLQKNNCSHV